MSRKHARLCSFDMLWWKCIQECHEKSSSCCEQKQGICSRNININAIWVWAENTVNSSVLLHLHHQTLQFFGEPPVPTDSGFYPHPPYEVREIKRDTQSHHRSTAKHQECGFLVFALPSLFLRNNASYFTMFFRVSIRSRSYHARCPLLFQYVHFNLQYGPSEDRSPELRMVFFLSCYDSTSGEENPAWSTNLFFLLPEPDAKNKATTCSQCLESIHVTRSTNFYRTLSRLASHTRMVWCHHIPDLPPRDAPVKIWDREFATKSLKCFVTRWHGQERRDWCVYTHICTYILYIYIYINIHIHNIHISIYKNIYIYSKTCVAVSAFTMLSRHSRQLWINKSLMCHVDTDLVRASLWLCGLDPQANQCGMRIKPFQNRRIQILNLNMESRQNMIFNRLVIRSWYWRFMVLFHL